MTQNINIPTVVDLVTAGDPELKTSILASTCSATANELNLRIEELESAIGQDNDDPIGRAYAIRSEESKSENIISK